MARTARSLLTMAVLTGWLAMPAARAQGPPQPPASAEPPPAGHRDFSTIAGDLPEALPTATLPPGNGEPEFLRSLPRPPEQPGSLLQPAPGPGLPPPTWEKYFELDPILDPPQWGKIGWFSDVQVGIIRPTIFFGQMRHGVNTPFGGKVIVAPGAAKQDWTAAPRIEIGYRLPSGFGGFSFSDRFFLTSGSGPFDGPAGSLTRSTSMGVNYSDWDYFSREYTPWANWGMEWRAGIRLAETWIDTHAGQSAASAAAGTGVLTQYLSNYTVGAGPHFGLQVNRFFPGSGFTLIGRIDIADTFTRVRQLFSVTTLAPGGGTGRGNWTENFWQEVPILNYQFGVGWQPPSNPNLSIYLGYIYEFWWQIGSNSNLTPQAGGPRGFFNNQGVLLQAQLKF